MAGIGFELKKMFEKRGLLSVIKAYGYAGIVCTGPMILGIVLLLGVRFLSGLAGATEYEVELLFSMVTYTMLASLIITNAFSLVTTRYTADHLYTEEPEKIMPSFWGSVSLMLILGGLVYGVFLLFAGVSQMYQFLCLALFGELVLVWTEINYLTAIKDYKGILLTFLVALIAAMGLGYLLSKLSMDIITAMLLSICFGYGIMSVWYYVLLAEYFPEGTCSSLDFLKWIDKYPQLFFLGITLSLGMFGHLVIMWFSPLQEQVEGWFFGAPQYDIPALLAFISILITTINFVTSVEVNFYPKYRNYFSLFNDGGSYMDIEQAEKEMKSTLVQELTYTFTKQFFATIVFILAGTLLLPYLPLGMNEDMLGIYRVLCIAYAFYAVGNCTMLIQLYFSDNTGALISGASFMAVSCIGTMLLMNGEIKYYGVGFLTGGVVFAVVSLLLLRLYMKRIMYHVLCNQPIVAKVNRSRLTEISEFFGRRYEKKYNKKYRMEKVEESGAKKREKKSSNATGGSFRDKYDGLWF